MIAGLKDAGGPALTEIGQASAHRLIETELDPMCEWCRRAPPSPRLNKRSLPAVRLNTNRGPSC